MFTFTPPDLSSYATQSYVTGRGYTTTASVNTLIANSLTNYTTTASVNTLIANSLTNYATQSYVTGLGYITTASLSVVTTSSGVSALTYNNGVFTFTPPNLGSYATQSFVTSQGYTTTASVNTLIANSLTNYVTSSTLTGKGYITTASLSVVTASSGTSALTYNNGVFTFTPPDLSSYGTITNIIAGTGTHVSTSTGAVTIWADGDNYYATTSTRTLSNTANTSQSIFGLTNGLAVEANTRYRYELVFNFTLTVSGAGSSVASYFLTTSSGATLSAHSYDIQWHDASGLTPSAGITIINNSITTGFATPVPFTGNITNGQQEQVIVWGIVDVVNAGYLNFMIQQNKTLSTWTMYPGANARVVKLGPIGQASLGGTWS